MRLRINCYHILQQGARPPRGTRAAHSPHASVRLKRMKKRWLEIGRESLKRVPGVWESCMCSSFRSSREWGLWGDLLRRFTRVLCTWRHGKLVSGSCPNNLKARSGAHWLLGGGAKKERGLVFPGFQARGLGCTDVERACLEGGGPTGKMGPCPMLRAEQEV